MLTAPTILWFRKDLRLEDNSALKAAIEKGAPVIPLFIWSPDESGAWAPGAASKWWLHQALKSLSESFKEVSGEFVLREGDSLGQLRDIIEKNGGEARLLESSLRVASSRD
jgi:deoxyribodipyrimidine photo-lyase